MNAARGQSYFRVLDDRPQLLRPPCSAGTEVGKQRQSGRLPDILKVCQTLQVAFDLSELVCHGFVQAVWGSDL